MGEIPARCALPLSRADALAVSSRGMRSSPVRHRETFLFSLSLSPPSPLLFLLRHFSAKTFSQKFSGRDSIDSSSFSLSLSLFLRFSLLRYCLAASPSLHWLLCRCCLKLLCRERRARRLRPSRRSSLLSPSDSRGYRGNTPHPRASADPENYSRCCCCCSFDYSG